MTSFPAAAKSAYELAGVIFHSFSAERPPVSALQHQSKITTTTTSTTTMRLTLQLLLLWSTVTLAGGLTSSKRSTSLADSDDFRTVSYAGMCAT